MKREHRNPLFKIRKILQVNYHKLCAIHNEIFWKLNDNYIEKGIELSNPLSRKISNAVRYTGLAIEEINSALGKPRKE